MSAPTLQVTLQQSAIIAETITNLFVIPPQNTVNFGIQQNIQLTGTTTPPASVFAIFTQALTSGLATIDLTALPAPDGTGTVTGLGLQLQAMYLQAPATNANLITIGKGGTNGYTLDGTTSWLMGLAPNTTYGPFYFDAGSDVVASGKKTMDMTGTGVQALNIILIFG